LFRRDTLNIMSDRIGNLVVKPRKQRAIAMAVLLTIAVTIDLAWPQAATQPAPQAQPSQQSAPAPQQSEPAPAPDAIAKENPGLLNEIGKLLENPSSMLPTMKSPKEAIEDLNARAKDMTKDAADGLSRLTKSPGVKGRVICPVAANGAPDCKAAADRLCQGKGFKEGKSLDIDTTRNCSAKALLSGRKPDESECRTDNYVTRALCQ
jgi:hypothetical protein